MRLWRNARGRVSGDYFTAVQRRHITLEARWHIAGYALVAAASVPLATEP